MLENRVPIFWMCLAHCGRYTAGETRGNVGQVGIMLMLDRFGQVNTNIQNTLLANQICVVLVCSDGHGA